MKSEFQKHKKSDAVKWIVVFFAIILLTVSVSAALTKGFTDGNPFGWFDKQQEKPVDEIIPDSGVTDENGNAMTSGKIYPMSSKMSFSSSALAASDNQGVTITLQAIVLPVDAKNKAVDWTVEWQTSSANGESPVTDFVTVTPHADGSNIADVTCFKSFENDTIVVTVTTREGGFSATCVVSFIGHPSVLNITPTGATVLVDSGWNASIATISSGLVYDFDLNFDNIYHSVDSNFIPNFTYELVGVGKFNLHKLHKRSNTTVSDEIISVSLTDKVPYEMVTSPGDILQMSISSQNLVVSFKNGKLHLEALKTISAFSTKSYYNSARTSYYQYTFDSFLDVNKKPYYQIKVTETKTGLSQTINVRVDSNVTSVSLNNSELSF